MGSVERRQQLLRESHRIFEAALLIPEASRPEFVTAHCHGDQELVNCVLRLVDEFDEASDIISAPFQAVSKVSVAGDSEFKGNSRFIVRRQIGTGAFGTVYAVWDREQRTHVALKLLHSWKSDALFRFKKEFRSLSEVRHPNLVHLYELFSEGDLWFFTMELIEGSNFLDYLRPKIKVGEWEQLRIALGQLVAGVHALHRCNRVHRDLKPGNVLVAKDGRVVVLDFGLVREIDALDVNATMSLVGTPAYMAPEQVLTGHVTPASDWYSVGVMLFQILTGKQPYQNPELRVWADDKRVVPAPRSINAAVPDDLNDICVALLQYLPAERPDAELLIRTTRATLHEPRSPVHANQVNRDFFVGRVSELAELEAAFADSQEGHLNVVLVEGASGIGKSTLIRKFITVMSERYPNLLALKGKCYEFESVPYKGVDALIDELSGYLQRISDTDIQALLPRDASLLPKLFPVLGRIKAIVKAPVRPLVPDEQELRQRTFASLREMIARLTDRYPLILWIDDFQWADRDSSTLLSEVCSPPQQPALLLVLTYRSEEVNTNPTLQYLSHALTSNNRVLGNWRQLVLPGLGAEESRTLVQHFAGRDPTEQTLGSIVKEGSGHPLFLRELATLLAKTDSDLSAKQIDLQAVLRTRISALPKLARELLELICLAAQPLTQKAAFEAASTNGDDHLSNVVALLVSENLLRVSGTGSRKRFEPFHDQIRTAVVSLISVDLKKTRHRSLATVLAAQEGIEPQVLVTHYRESGDFTTAYNAALAAAQAAERQLAFDRAAVFYEAAIEMGSIGGGVRIELYRKLADSLGKAGRGRDSAQAYVKAAEYSSGRSAFEMRRLAADQFIRSGYIGEGMKLFSKLANRLGVKIPCTPREAVSGILIGRMRTRARLALPLLRAKIPPKPKNSERLELLRTGAVILNIVDPVAAAYFQVNYVADAIKAGDLVHLATALALEAGIRAATTSRNPGGCFSLLDKAQKLAEESKNHNTQGVVYLCRSYVDYLLMLIPEGATDSRKAIDFLRTHCTGVAWELTAAYVLLFWFKCWAGEVAEVRTLLPQLLKEGAARGDVNVEVSLRLLSYVHFAYLAADESEECLAECQRALSRWPGQGFTLQHYGGMFVQVETHLYRGDYQEARRVLLHWWERLAGSMILRWRVLTVMATFLRGRVALACWLDHRTDNRLRREIEEYAKRLERIRSHWCPPMVSVLRAGIASGDGNCTDAAALLNTAQHGFEKASLHAFSSAAEHLSGALCGGAEGQIRMQSASQFIGSQQVRKPEAFLRMLIPGQWPSHAK